MGSQEIRLEVNADKTKHMVMSRGQNAGRCNNIKVLNSSFEWVEEFKYLGTTIKNQNSIQEEIKSTLKPGKFAIIWCSILCLPFGYPKI